MQAETTRQIESSGIRWDVIGGLVMIAIALPFLIIGLRLQFGTPSQMGPGFLPVCAAVILTGLGAVVVVEGLTRALTVPNFPKLRPLLVVVACPIVFGWMIGWAGMVPTVIVTSLLARMAEPLEWGWDLLLVPLTLVAISVLVFIKFVGISIPII